MFGLLFRRKMVLILLSSNPVPAPVLLVGGGVGSVETLTLAKGEDPCSCYCSNPSTNPNEYACLVSHHRVLTEVRSFLGDDNGLAHEKFCGTTRNSRDFCRFMPPVPFCSGAVAGVGGSAAGSVSRCLPLSRLRSTMLLDPIMLCLNRIDKLRFGPEPID